VLGNGAYRLETLEGESFLERGTWRISIFTLVKVFSFNAFLLNNNVVLGDALLPSKGFFNEIT